MSNNFLAKLKGILIFCSHDSSLNNVPLMLHDRVYLLLISKSSQLLSEPVPYSVNYYFMAEHYGLSELSNTIENR